MGLSREKAPEPLEMFRGVLAGVGAGEEVPEVIHPPAARELEPDKRVPVNDCEASDREKGKDPVAGNCGAEAAPRDDHGQNQRRKPIAVVREPAQVEGFGAPESRGEAAAQPPGRQKERPELVAAQRTAPRRRSIL
eukprot:CAMPEP_0172628602 /NCGR_PEP_ID=MMETSP1068-20121228/162840_1 /TAXON_ID=35684 /ORGANISM="Pseudopedinella elastica, Strain CCMP716" /LENGTH=135 /DNA_ID=CAMNT_0013438869 /DNA_START=344 /DNA_END=749 /DNA_ORIENTATION=-